jgi:DNA-binding XRE family transcriptional regulator
MIDFGPTAKIRTISEIRAATRTQKTRPTPNAEAIAWRRSLGISQVAMAKRVGVSPARWQRIEEGRVQADGLLSSGVDR